MNLRIRADVARAARDVVPQWPLSSFIAVNPLAGHERTAFESMPLPGVALTRPVGAYLGELESGRITLDDVTAALLERLPELRVYPVRLGFRELTAVEILVSELTTSTPAEAEAAPVLPPPDVVDELTAKWVAAFLDPDPLWPIPHREDGLYAAWRTLAACDPDLSRAARRVTRSLPPRPDDAISRALTELQVAPHDEDSALQRELAGLPGWAAHIKWRSEHRGDIDLVDYLAVRLSLRVLLGLSVAAPVEAPGESEEGLWVRAARMAGRLGAGQERASVAAVARVLALHPVSDHAFTLQRAYELRYSRGLLHAVGTGPAPAVPPARIQLVACIDPRSEGIRRHLEQGDATIETFGFAGFFGVPMRFATYDSPASVDSLPALLSPRHFVTEEPRDSAAARTRARRLRLHQALASGIHAGESTTASPFAFAEVSGWLFGAATALRTLAPRTAAAWAAAFAAVPPLETSVTVAQAFSLEERAGLAEAALRMMGLSRFAPLVILSGHGSTSTNNLYESALDCGACGGNPGNANARAAAAIFNDPEVRVILSERGLPIPVGTFFIAAEHDTVTDHIVALDAHLVPKTHQESVAEFGRLQLIAADALIRERARSLPGASPRQRPATTRGRAADWAEVYPEWGLVGNAAFIIGPRELTRGCDLERRVFLHSYVPELDPTGAALETILTAPVVVAQWINHQYYFSALNPGTLGAGTKTVHNALGTIGVLSGQGGDLRRGLPWQSVGVGDRLVHEAMRLAVVVQAPLERITSIIGGNAVLRALFDNNWITLTAREHSDSPWYSYGRYGWTPSASATPHQSTPAREGATS